MLESHEERQRREEMYLRNILFGYRVLPVVFVAFGLFGVCSACVEYMGNDGSMSVMEATFTLLMGVFALVAYVLSRGFVDMILSWTLCRRYIQDIPLKEGQFRQKVRRQVLRRRKVCELTCRLSGVDLQRLLDAMFPEEQSPAGHVSQKNEKNEGQAPAK